MVRVRRNVWDLVSDPNDKTLEWYARAVAAMQARPISDYRSWRYQAAIHEYNRRFDPFAQPTDELPSAADQERFWTQCQHNSWFFLPWHRMYLHHFEQIVATEIMALGGPSDWALPYWNYSKDDASRRLPPPFRSPTLADGSPNPLFVEARNPACNQGEDFADDFDVSLTRCLRARTYANPWFGGTPGFGGPVTGFNHGGGPIGLVEGIPHGSMHVAIGGDGWMSSFGTAALDPVFWLHHANIDRLWEVWLRRDESHTNPTTAFWRSGVRFHFRNVDGAAVSMVCADVIDTEAPPLEYRYDDVSDPLHVTPQLESMGAVEVSSTMAEHRTPEMVGATPAPFEMGDGAQRVIVPMAEPEAPGLEAMGADDEPKRMYLHIENLTSDAHCPAYDVYLGVPEGADPSEHLDKRVERLALFGLTEASRRDGPHAGSGLTFALDVTDLVERLRREHNWSPRDLSVLFVPVRGKPGARVRVGRVSLYVG